MYDKERATIQAPTQYGKLTEAQPSAKFSLVLQGLILSQTGKDNQEKLN